MKLVVPFVVAWVLALWPSLASAAEEIGLSRDRVHWTPNLTEPLFDPEFRWVPGDRETASFWVRNQSSDRALLDVAVLGSDLDSLLQTGDLDISVAAAHGSGASTKTTGRHELLSSRVVEPGQTERIDVTVAFDSASTNQSQVKALDLAFEVRLTQNSFATGDDTDDDDNDGDDDADDDDRNGILPGTGGPEWWLLPAGLLGVGVGWLTVVASRRKEAARG